MNYSTSCSCGKIEVAANFPSPIEEYQARECDCDFCTSRGLAYLSDINGTISFAPKETMNQLKQSSGQATFWECDSCHDVVAVKKKKNGVVKGAVSKRLFAQHFKLKPSITVSPKNLSASEKSDRWPTVWSTVI